MAILRQVTTYVFGAQAFFFWITALVDFVMAEGGMTPVIFAAPVVPIILLVLARIVSPININQRRRRYRGKTNEISLFAALIEYICFGVLDVALMITLLALTPTVATALALGMVLVVITVAAFVMLGFLLKKNFDVAKEYRGASDGIASQVPPSRADLTAEAQPTAPESTEPIQSTAVQPAAVQPTEPIQPTAVQPAAAPEPRGGYGDSGSYNETGDTADDELRRRRGF